MRVTCSEAFRSTFKALIYARFDVHVLVIVGGARKMNLLPYVYDNSRLNSEGGKNCKDLRLCCSNLVY